MFTQATHDIVLEKLTASKDKLDGLSPGRHRTLAKTSPVWGI